MVDWFYEQLYDKNNRWHFAPSLNMTKLHFVYINITKNLSDGSHSSHILKADYGCV